MLYVEQAGAADDEALIIPLGPRAGGAAPLARVWRGNALQLDRRALERFAGTTLLINSGSLGDDLGAPVPRNWMAGAAARLADHLFSLRPDLVRLRIRLLIEPHCRHILHDALTAAVFLREHGDAHIGLALNPVALFEPSMIPHREDHLLRIAEALAAAGAAFILADAAPDPAGENLDPADLGCGAFDPRFTLQVLLDPARPARAKHEAVPRPVIVRRPQADDVGVHLISDLRALLEPLGGD